MGDLLKEFNLEEKDWNVQVSETHLVEISKLLGSEWREMPPTLGFDLKVVDDIIHELPFENERRLRFLEKWRKKGFEATYKKLIYCLIHLKHKNAIGVICELVKKLPPIIPHPSTDRMDPAQTGN